MSTAGGAIATWEEVYCLNALWPALCAKANACFGAPCQNGGTCYTSADCFSSYYCACTNAYTGVNCETIIGFTWSGQLVANSEYCYWLDIDKTGRTWADGRTYCQAGGGDIATIQTMNDWAAVMSYLQSNTDSTYYTNTVDWVFWTGYKQLSTAWANGDATATYFSWAALQPDGSGDCVQAAARVVASWDDVACTSVHPPLCSIKNACFGTPCLNGGTCSQ